jgi:DNA polymerase-3 subunit alpha
MGITVRVPDVNVSLSNFGSLDGDITFGLSAIRNVGEGLVALLIEEREANGPFSDFYDLCERVDPSVLNKRSIESLIKAGAFDSLGHPRKGLLRVHDQIIDRVLAARRERDMGVMTLFGEASGDDEIFNDRIDIPDVEFDKRERLAFEKEMLGLYISDHPLMGAEAALRRRTDATLTDLVEAGDGAMRTVGGVVTSLQRKYTRKGELMAVFTLEDLQSSMEVMVFPRTMRECGHVLVDDQVVCLTARLDARDDTPKLIANDVVAFEPVTDGAPPVRVRLPAVSTRPDVLDRLKDLIQRHPGESQVLLHLGEGKVLRLTDDFCVESRNGFVGELRELLGPEALVS